jgi:hypothetical protein
LGRLLLWLAACAPLLWGLTRPTATPPKTVLLIAGDFGGYLAPCGCTKPMSGGIRRLATAVKDLGPKNRTVFLATGSLVGKPSRQDELKAETIAEALKACGVDALGLTSQDLALGEAMIGSIDRLSGNRVLSGGAGGSAYREVPPFLVGVSLPGTSEQSARALAKQAEQSRLIPVLLLDGGLDTARKLAEAVPSLALIVYRHAGSASERPIVVEKCRLVTPGNRGKALLRIEWTGSEFQGYAAVDLGPSFADDEQVSRLYANYQRRVAGERLLEKLPRRASEPFAGNQTCGSCHRSAEATWKESRHAGALKTLEQDHHDRDPDCTGCHVVGLDLAEGFRSRAETPQLTDVGCESCHGPGLAHAKEPYAIKMPKVGAKSCVPCHVPDHSPGFDFETYWPKIRH